MAVFKESNQIKEVDDAQEVVQDFARRSPFWSYRTISYKDYEPLLQLIPVLDAHLERLFAGEIDDANGDVLDCLIFDIVRQALENLKYQRVNHTDTNRNFAIRLEGDIQAFKEEIEDVQEDLDDINREYKYLMSLYRKNEYGKDISHEE